MPSFLGDYPGCATGRQMKFIRAVKSFLDQTYKDKELVIVSDGCEITNKLVENNFKNEQEICLVKLEKQPLFSGSVRQAGIDLCTGEVVCFLDTDDYILPHHLVSLSRQIQNEPWVIFNDYIKNGGALLPRVLEIKHGTTGTSNIAYKKSLPVSWAGCDGYGHDWLFIQKLIAVQSEPKRAYGMAYCVCHVPHQVDE